MCACVRSCVCARARGIKYYDYIIYYFRSSYVYIIADLVKRGVLTLLMRYAAIEMTATTLLSCYQHFRLPASCNTCFPSPFITPSDVQHNNGSDFHLGFDDLCFAFTWLSRLPGCYEIKAQHNTTQNNTHNTHTHKHTHARTHVRTHERTLECTHARTHTDTHARAHTHTDIHIHAHTHTYAHARTHSHTHARARAHTRTLTHYIGMVFGQ